MLISSQHAPPPAVAREAVARDAALSLGRGQVVLEGDASIAGWPYCASASPTPATSSRSPSSRSWTGVDGRGRAGQRVGAAGRPWEARSTSRMLSRPAEQRHDDRSSPKRDPAVRRRAVAQRVEQEAEPRLGLLARRSRSARRSATARRCDGYGSSRRRSRCRRARGRRSARAASPGSPSRIAGGGAGAVNGWCSASQRCSSGSPDEHRELDHPEDVVAPSGDQVEAPRDLQAQRAEHLVGGRRARRRRSAAGRPGCASSCAVTAAISRSARNLAIGERQPRSSGCDERPHQALGAVLLGQLGERVELGARAARARRR